MPEIIAPIIHMNGDRAEVLIAALDNAYDTVQMALLALGRCAPNGRNFYPVPGLLECAEAQHHERMLHLSTLLASLKGEISAIHTR